MPAPTVPANCPRGLEYLSQVDQLLVKQKIEVLEGKYANNNEAKVCVEIFVHIYSWRDKDMY